MTTNRIGPRIWTTMCNAKRTGGAGATATKITANLGKTLCLLVLAASAASQPAVAADDAAQSSEPSCLLSAQECAAAATPIDTQPAPAHSPKRANFEREHASRDARQVADWVVDSGDNHAMPFVIVDKTGAKVFVFNADGELRGAAPALLGLAHGDDSVPGIGEREMSAILPAERTTPAGRFVAALGRNFSGKDILWVDYEAAISLHRVITTKPKERRLQRLATPTPTDNRISYGCINVPAKFYENVVSPAFTGTNGIVYVLPETRSSRAVFALYDVEERARAQTTSRPVPAQIASQPDLVRALNVATGMTGTLP